ncbi:hypothetical protein FRB90_011143 [Tulasnella sp. 427]|nr:hypothetical protein FRB90_011143 [Tulasnella sp. 427]
MGRRKIEIQPITHDRNRSVTFLKRKNGLFKKAYELGVLCSVDVCVIVFAHNGKLHEYSSGDSSAILERRLKYSGDRDLRRPSDFTGAKGGRAAGGGDKDSDGEDEGDSGAEEPVPVAPVNGVKRKATNDSKMSISNERSDSFGSSSRDQSNSYGHGANDVSIAFSIPWTSMTDNVAQHSTPLPPSSHPLSIGGLSASSYLGSSTPTPANATTIAQHHQQLAQQFLVNQLQNINPNLNSQPAAASGAAFPFGLGGLGVPPRGGGMILPFAGLGIAGNASSAPPAGPAVLPPGAEAYSNAFLSSLIGNAAAAAAAAQHQANNPPQEFRPPQGVPFPGLEWPGARPANPASSASSSSTSIPRAPSPQARQQPHPLAGTNGVENNWLDLLLGSGAGGAGGPVNAEAKSNPSSTIFPIWSNGNTRPQAGGGSHPPAASPGRSETPLDGVPISDTIVTLGGNSNKRPRGGSSPASRATPGMQSDDGRMALDERDRPSSRLGKRSPVQMRQDEDDEDGGRSDSGASEGKRRRTE